MNPVNAIFDEHLKHRLGSIEIPYVVQYSSLENPVPINTTKGITVSVQRGAYIVKSVTVYFFKGPAVSAVADGEYGSSYTHRNRRRNSL